MDKFDLAENEGRALFKTILDLLQITDYRESTDKFDTLDMYCNSDKTGIEIKKRDLRFEWFDTYVMELSKYNALVERINKGEVNSIYYANFFGDDICYIFSLRDIAKGIKENKIKSTVLNANKTTAIYTGKVVKLVLLLPKELATKLVRVDNRWSNPNKKKKQ